MRFRAAKKDENHAPIVAGLLAVGCSVLELHAVGGGCPDLLVGYDRWNILLEIKRPGVAGRKRGAKQARTNELQAEFREKWRGLTPVVVSSLAEAYAAVGVRVR